MERGRFSLLQLDPGEIYFEDFSVVFIPSGTTQSTYDNKKQDGRLKMCSKSLVFEPKDIGKPILKIPLKDCIVIEKWKGNSSFITSENVLYINSKEHIEMFEGNIIAPYKYMENYNFLFLFNYAIISDYIPHILQLYRASSLPAVEQSVMIATIVYSRQSRVNFDPLWLDLYEKVVTESQADKISPLVVNPGRILLSTSRLYYQPYNNIEQAPVLKIDLSNINRIVKRRFLLRHTGLEIYSHENSITPHIYLSFRNQTERDNFHEKLLEQPNLKLSKMEQYAMTLQWQNGVISNYEYLLYINSLGDRTFNDLTQYPVFPWVLSNYTSKEIDLNDPKNYRDLSKPMGALNSERLQRLIDRFDEMSEPKFIYGSHYSTPGFVLFYLARCFPHYVLCLQSGRFDHPDRMFNSISDVYKNCLFNMADFKELVPEFYDVSQGGKFLKNDMGINFGCRHNGLKVGDVDLPPWAEGPKDFVDKMRQALESDFVSQNLHQWIDLVFGYKQRGEEALKANNLFYYLCYEGGENLESITDLNERHAKEVQIMEFGQIPKQVFKVPHPQRKVGLQNLVEPQENSEKLEPFQNHGRWSDIFSNISEMELVANFNSHKNTVSCLFISKDNVISVGHDSKLKVFSISKKRQIRSATIGDIPLSSCIQLPDLNVLVIGSWDNQIILYDLDYGKIKEEVLAHEDAVTCLCWGQTTNLLVSGSGDCTVKIWKGFSNNGIIKPIQCLHKHIDHNSPVNCAHFHPDDTYLAIGTQDGEIYIWDTKLFTLFKKYSYPSSIIVLKFSPDGTKIAFSDSKKQFQIIDTNTGMEFFSKTFNFNITSLCWNNFLLVLGGENGQILIWNILEVKLLYEFQAHKDAITTIDVSFDDGIISTGSKDAKIYVWKPKSV